MLGHLLVNSRPHVACGSTHLTAYVGIHFSDGLEFGVNSVDPIHDSGKLAVRPPSCVCSTSAVVA